MTRASLATVACLLACSAVVSHAQEQGVKALASDLASYGVPASFVVPQELFMSGKVVAVRRPATSKERAAFSAQLPFLVTTWNRSRPTTATLDAGFVRVTVADAPEEVLTILNTQLAVKPQTLTVADALILLPALIRGDVERRPVIGSGQAFQNCQWNRQLTLAEGPLTAQGYLDGLVRAVPGFVWLVTFNRDSPRQSFSVTMACEGGSYTTLTVFD